jgi:ribosome production factor 2
MGVLQRVVKPRNQRSKRALEAREPKTVENAKKTLFVRTNTCSHTVHT